MIIGEPGAGGTPDPDRYELMVEQLAAAAERGREVQGQVEEFRRQREEGKRFPDAPERLARRAQRLLQSGAVPGEVLVAMEPGVDPVEADERIIGDANDMQSVAFLPRGVRVAATVARIWLKVNGRPQACATGFMVGPRLLLTNHHVFRDFATAQDAFAEFDAEAGLDDMPKTGVPYKTAPEVFFANDKGLDYALVALAPGLDGRHAGEVFGWNRLDPAEGKIVVGDPVNIIGHPSGRPKEIAIRSNELVVRLDDFLHYATDTEPGNSGSPVFNDQWEVVALHHRGVPKTDEQGRVLNLDGKPWTSAQGDAAVAWVANEGARISSVLRHLAAHTPAELHPVLAEIGPGIGAPAPAAAGPTTASAAAAALTPGAPAVLPQALVPQALVPQPLTPPATVVPGADDASGKGTTAASDPAAASIAGAGAVPGVVPAAASTASAGVVPGSPPAAVAVPLPRAAESAILTGVAGRPEAFGAARQLVFLHGRSQQGRHPESLRRQWTDGLNSGLARLGYATLDPADIYFPYYGDRLAAVLDAHESVSATSFDSVADDPAAAAAPESGSARELYTRLLFQAADAAGMPDESDAVHTDERFGLGGVVRVARRPLDWLARHSGVDRLVIAGAFRDVARYLDDRRVRDEVLACVRETVPSSGGIVLVAHSLGTLVAMDLLAVPADGPAVSALVTLGAPLGMDTVYDRLLTRGPHCPQRVPWWFNAWAPGDGVAIGCPLAGRWSGLTAESSVDNPRDRAHDFDEYLARPEVAGAIASRLELARR
ncbi:S1 family peptidase [Yinghuangia soli]|uniref:Serine protease n=1 Tax=Yinghuangia soli TaxID=2908204 RepID=A0AA41U2V4_9ACTN|nr:serine protease [Yinghuangia soli]MCF2529067.1 trypsin-like peptidase domain-containing protein [Yinghuangia soli]